MEKKPAHLPAFLIACVMIQKNIMAGLSCYCVEDDGSIVRKNMRNMINLYEYHKHLDHQKRG